MAKASMNFEPKGGLTSSSKQTPLRKTAGGTPFGRATIKSKRTSSRSAIGRRR